MRVLGISGYEVLGWDRAAVCPDDAAAGDGFLAAVDPEWVVHLGMGAEAWAGRLAAWCRDRGRRFLFSSSAMVFDAAQGGPYSPGAPRRPQDDYGRYKARCEDAVLDADPDSLVIRIGWQIGTERGGNEMLEARYGDSTWEVRATEDYAHDQRLLDPRVEIASLGSPPRVTASPRAAAH